MKPTAGDYEEKHFQLNTKTIIMTYTMSSSCNAASVDWTAHCDVPWWPHFTRFSRKFFSSLIKNIENICDAYDMSLIL